MTIRKHNNRAFTLVEILIVVVILGILAAIVIPQFTNASEEAMESSLRSQLQTIRSQIELYRVKNNGAMPTTSGLLDFTLLVNGNYLQAAPVNPLQSSATVADAPAAGVGWVWTDADEHIDATNQAGDGVMGY
ncbi:MAG: type II secretion system protein [Planctomycetota bacterium]